MHSTIGSEWAKYFKFNNNKTTSPSLSERKIEINSILFTDFSELDLQSQKKNHQLTHVLNKKRFSNKSVLSKNNHIHSTTHKKSEFKKNALFFIATAKK